MTNEQRLEAIKFTFRYAERRERQFIAEKQALIDKACKWWKNELTFPTMTQAEIDWYQAKIEDFKKSMEGE